MVSSFYWLIITGSSSNLGLKIIALFQSVFLDVSKTWVSYEAVFSFFKKKSIGLALFRFRGKCID